MYHSQNKIKTFKHAKYFSFQLSILSLQILISNAFILTLHYLLHKTSQSDTTSSLTLLQYLLHISFSIPVFMSLQLALTLSPICLHVLTSLLLLSLTLSCSLPLWQCLLHALFTVSAFVPL